MCDCCDIDVDVGSWALRGGGGSIADSWTTSQGDGQPLQRIGCHREGLEVGKGSKRVEDDRGELGPTTYNHSVDDWEVGLVVVVVMSVVVMLKMSLPRVFDLVS